MSASNANTLPQNRDTFERAISPEYDNGHFMKPNPQLCAQTNTKVGACFYSVFYLKLSIVFHLIQSGNGVNYSRAKSRVASDIKMRTAGLSAVKFIG